jgi:hypothetical protein
MFRKQSAVHTETEAHHLWCPMVRHEGEGASFNRGWQQSNPLNATRQESFLCNCIGSRCAAWRWGAPAGRHPGQLGLHPRPLRHHPGALDGARERPAATRPLRPDPPVPVRLGLAPVPTRPAPAAWTRAAQA